MDIADFKQALELGLGRVILHLQTYDATPYRDDILHACLHNTAYDRQLEGNRAEFMFEVIQLTAEKDFYRDQILNELANPSADHDDAQLLTMIRLFAQQGDEQARQVLYDTWTQGDFSGADELIKLDGLEGLLVIADGMGETLLPEDDRWWYAYVFNLAQEKLGETEMLRALENAAIANSHIRAFISVVEELRAQDEKQPKRPRRTAPSSYDELKQMIMTRDILTFYQLKVWGQQASDIDLERAATDLLREQDAKRLCRYLNIFRTRRFPLDHERLMALVNSANNDIAFHALAALAPIKHPAVRAYALQLMDSPRWRKETVQMLVNNYADGDYALIQALADKDLSKDEVHALGFDVRDFYQAHPDKDAIVPLLLTLYEKEPCSMCRERFIDLLLSLDALPNWMREECQYDASLHIRAKIKELGEKSDGGSTAIGH